MGRIDLVIVTGEPFPFGMAPTNRILSYAKEIAQKYSVKVYIQGPTDYPDSIVNRESRGVYDGVQFEYANGYSYYPKGMCKIKKGFLFFMSFYSLYRNLSQNKPTSVILVSNDILLMWIIYFYSKILGFQYFQEKSEKPPVMKKQVNKLYKMFYLRSYRLFTGMIVMTNELKEIFTSLSQKNIYHLPMTVDIKRFSEFKQRANDDGKILFKYCGGGNYSRDGLRNMVEAFIDLNRNFPNFEFHIIGPIDKSSKYISDIIQTVARHELGNKIQFIGKVNSQEIPILLAEASYLIMAPPQDFSSGGFPTKLGEYLATGNPTICTLVSEVPLYLNEKNALLIKPDNHLELVSLLNRIMKSPDQYTQIGKEGRVLAEDRFTMSSHTDKLIRFLKLDA